MDNIETTATVLPQRRISLTDFKSWLQGVEDMQENGWVPSATQWKKIREKIDSIEVTTIQNNVPTGPQYRAPTTPIPAQASAFDGQPFPIPTPSPSNRMTTFVPPPVPQHFMTPKTPDIDTSGGNYVTNFA